MLVPNHSYVVLDQLELHSGQRLILLRNPWGREEYNGAWSDGDRRRWTPSEKAQRGIPEDDDGMFYINVEDYLEQMDVTFINYDTSNWAHSYFMMWNDPMEETGNHFWCGPTCTKHVMWVKSDIAQEVRIGAHAYRFYTYADAKGTCPVRDNDPQIQGVDFETASTIFDENATVNVIKNERNNRTRTFTNGDGWLPSLDFDAGEEVMITVEFNWVRQGVTKDWALTAWGTDGGAVYVRHDKGYESKHFNFTPNGGMGQISKPEEGPGPQINSAPAPKDPAPAPR